MSLRVDAPRLEQHRRQHHDDAIDVHEPAQRHPLIGNAVLHTRDRHRVPCRRDLDVSQRGHGVLRLGREQYDVVVAEGRLTDRLQHRHTNGRDPVRESQTQAIRAHGRRVLAPRDEHNVAARVVQPATDRAADRTSPDDDVSHGGSAAKSVGHERSAEVQCEAVGSLCTAHHVGKSREDWLHRSSKAAAA